MLKSTLVALAFGTTLAIASQPSANAMEFGSADAGKNTLIITMQGKIEPGDTVKLNQFLKTMPATAHIGAWAMSSQGGVVNEAVQMGEVILKTGAMTLLPDNVTCASACFWLFAAGQSRMMVSTAQLGVHGTKDEQGKEAPEGTVDSARFAKQIGIPDSVIVAMVTTPPDQITWLSPRQLTEMEVKIVPPSQQTASTSPPPPIYTPAPAAPPTPAPAPATAFMNGYADRRAYEAWVEALPEGQYKEGAYYWASVRSTPKASMGCYGSGYTGAPDQQDWASGCLAAKARLDPTDRRRNSESDYKAGWNSASREIAGPKPWNRDPGPTGETEASTAYQTGLTERTQLETWLRSIGDGPYHSGAAYWLGVRSTPQKVDACYPGGVASTDGYTEGCVAAKKMTDPMDYRRTHEPDYKAGWNNYSGPGA
jgi:hypothetical protein